MMQRTCGRYAAAALVGAALASVAVAAEVTTPAGTSSQSVTTGTTATPATAGAASARRAFRDPVTGQLRAPTPEETQAMLDEERAMRAARGEREPTGPVAPLSVRRYSNGMRSAVLGPEYLVSLTANRTPDGKVTITHDRPGHDHAAAPTQSPTE